MVVPPAYSMPMMPIVSNTIPSIVSPITASSYISPAVTQSRSAVNTAYPPVFETNGGSYSFQAASGYFWDPISQYYYDPKSKLYYNSKDGGYYRYDPALFSSGTYLCFVAYIFQHLQSFVLVDDISSAFIRFNPPLPLESYDAAIAAVADNPPTSGVVSSGILFAIINV